jgi:3-hydroxymyristoyl/3-hydroxydecanoyl-(acyl carrier protein) dehydratase
MRLLPEILREQRDGDRLELELRVPGDLACFDGHFPGRPVLPGVAQVDWSARYARERLGLRGEFCAAENLKFFSMVAPGARLTLKLRLEDSRLSFEFADEARKVSSGTLVFSG